MKVKVLPIYQLDVDRLLWTAARTCYSNKSPIELYADSLSKSTEELEEVILKTLDYGHLSIVEHCNFNILIEGVSRALTHQLVRHRHCTFSQQSQRYCKAGKKGFNYVVPDNIANIPLLKNNFEAAMYSLSELYNILIESGIQPEDARSILPNACCSNVVLTCNLRELMHICNERLCACAQKEIRQLIKEIAKQVISFIPWTSKYLQPKCERLNYCPESKNRSCGRKPVNNK